MRLSQIMFSAWVVLAVWNGVAAAAGGTLAFRAPLVQAGNFKMPEYIVGARPELKTEEAFRERLNRMSLYLDGRRVGDMEFFGVIRASGNLKFEADKVTEFQKKFEASNKRLQDVLADKTLKAEDAYNKAVEILRERETEFSKFLGEQKGTAEFHTRPGEIKKVEDWGNVLVFAKGAEGVSRASEGQVESTKGSAVHDEVAGESRTGSTQAANDRAVQNLWTAGGACKGLCGRLDAQLGSGSPMSKSVIGKINEVLESFSRQGNSIPATNFLLKIKDVVDAMEKLPGGSKNALRDILVEMLKSRGVSDTSLDELTAFANGGDVDALQGMHRMANTLRRLREQFAKDQKEPTKGTAAHEEWVARRDKFVGDKLKDWVDYGEEFRSSVARMEGEKGFDAWMKGTHEHDRKAETDASKRPEKELGAAFCDNCGGWMRKSCGT